MAGSASNEKRSNLLFPTHDAGTSPLGRPQSGTSGISTLNEKTTVSSSSPPRRSVSSNVNTISSSKGSFSAENREKQRAVRTLPPWVQTVDEDDDTLNYSLRPPRANASRPPQTPPIVRPAAHHWTPQPREGAASGRAYDHERVREPVTITTPFSDRATQWQSFVKASGTNRLSSSRDNVVDDNWLKDNMADLSQPWTPEDQPSNDDDEAGFWLLNPTRRKRKIKKAHNALMRDPRVPAVFRFWVLVMSLIALGLSVTIYTRTGGASLCVRGSSTYMAIVIDVIAVPYTLWITWDEYTNKPLGLRPHRAKMRLLFLDLLFIVFDAANLSVAFEALTDPRWVCKESNNDSDRCNRDSDVCNRQIGLTVVLLLALLAWLFTFSISTLRVIERAVKR